MLVLSRKKNEVIVINDNITVMIVEIRGDKVRVGVTCDKSIPVHRSEVHDAIHNKSHNNALPSPPTYRDPTQAAPL